MNRALSIRSQRTSGSGSGMSSTTAGPPSTIASAGSTTRRGFSFSSLRGSYQPELSRRLYRLIKNSNHVVSAHQAAGRERVSIATQLSEWGEQTGDEAVSDLSDKVGVVLSELGEQEDAYAHALDEARSVLKTVRNTEKSVQPSRDGRNRVADEIARLKAREPESARLVVLEQELVRAEAENLVAEAQLTNVTRQKLKEAYEAEFRATIERAEKQALLAKHGLRLLQLLDVTPVVPGDRRREYPHAQHAQQILRDAEDDLRDWRLRLHLDFDNNDGDDDHDQSGGGKDVVEGGGERRDEDHEQQDHHSAGGGIIFAGSSSIQSPQLSQQGGGGMSASMSGGLAPQTPDRRSETAGTEAGRGSLSEARV